MSGDLISNPQSPITHYSSRRAAFTLIELLVVVAILSILMALFLPALQRAKDAARTAGCVSTLRQIMVATLMYADDHDGFMPKGIMAGGVANNTGYGFNFTPSNVFDNDPESTGADQEICGVGQLMWGRYLPENAEAISCPAADYRQNWQSGASLAWVRHAPDNSPQSLIDWWLKRPASDPQYWRSDYGAGGGAVYRSKATYVVRGPLYKLSALGSTDYMTGYKDIHASRFAFFADHEAIPAGPSWTQGWPKVHRAGINVAYADGHVELFKDPDRSITGPNSPNFWGIQQNGNALWSGAYDR
jgi:prepilin-type N-terminal cleavage/methylation domain-containing protein/prepilin-type processing-associated H-X9-DG protein